MSPPRTGDQSFLGPRVPPQIEALSRGLKELDHGLVRRLLKAVVGALEGRDSRDALRAVTEDCEASEETLSHVTSGIYLLMTSAIRERDLRPEVFKEDLRDLKIPEELIADISSVVFGSRRGALDAAASHSTPHLPTLEQLQWRVDVSISSGSLSRALQPSVLMQMKLSDGSLKQFEVPVSRFQELRYNVALILKEMNHLEKRNVLKIQD